MPNWSETPWAPSLDSHLICNTLGLFTGCLPSLYLPPWRLSLDNYLVCNEHIGPQQLNMYNISILLMVDFTISKKSQINQISMWVYLVSELRCCYLKVKAKLKIVGNSLVLGRCTCVWLATPQILYLLALISSW